MYQRNIFSQKLALCLGVFVLAFLIGLVVFAWTEPTTEPPEGNVPAPINVGSTGQSKAGGLILNTGGAATGLIVDKGNVGIGATSPAERLHVIGNAKIEGTVSASAFSGASPIIFTIGGIERMRITDAGNVGIGTTNPTTKLQIVGATSIVGWNNTGFSMGGTENAGALNAYLFRQNIGGDTTYGRNYATIVSNDAYYDGTNWIRRNQYTAPAIITIGGDGTSTGIFRYMVGPGGTGPDQIFTPSELFRINYTGNVGIGTTTPGAKLEVAGQIKITGGSPGAGKVLTSDASGLASWQTPAGGGLPSGTSGQTLRHDGTNWVANSLLFNNGTNIGIGTTGPGAKLDVRGDQKIGGSITFNPGGAIWPKLYRESATGGLFIATTDGTTTWDRMVIQNNGTVGIGTISPDSNYKLTTVGGGVKAENATTQPAGYFSSTGGGNAIQTGTGTILFGNLSGTGTRMVVANASGVLSTQAISGLPSGTSGQTLRHDGTNWVANSLLFNNGTNIGIGTTSPDSNYKLTTVGGGVKAENATTQPAGYFSSTGGKAIQTGTGAILFGNLSGTGTRMVVANDSGVLSAQAISGLPSGTSGQTLRHDGTNWVANSLLFNDGASVGIGTTSPIAKLDVRNDLSYQFYAIYGRSTFEPTAAQPDSIGIGGADYENQVNGMLGRAWRDPASGVIGKVGVYGYAAPPVGYNRYAGYFRGDVVIADGGLTLGGVRKTSWPGVRVCIHLSPPSDYNGSCSGLYPIKLGQWHSKNFVQSQVCGYVDCGGDYTCHSGDIHEAVWLCSEI